MIPHHCAKDDRRWISEQIRAFPFRFRPGLAKRYSREFIKGSRQQANLSMLEIREQLEKSPVNLSHQLSDAEIVEKAKRIAKRCGQLAQESNGFEKMFFYAVDQVTVDYLPEIEYKTKEQYQAGIIGRLSDDLWWRRVLRKQRGRIVEAFGRDINLVNRNDGIYCTDETQKRRADQKHRNRQLLETIKAVNELDQEYTLQQLSDLGVSNPEIRRSELMTRIRGFTDYAELRGHVGEFWTITLPSKYHASLSKTGTMNPKYQNLTPREGQNRLVADWALVRSQFQKAGVEVYGFRVVEPHQDGTPHWHMLLFMRPEHRYKARQIYYEYAIRENRNEVFGREHVRFKAKPMNSGGAAGYIAKYISKNVDGHRVEKDLYGKDAVTSAQRIEAWAACWGIRQFQQLGGHSVTVWRDLRKLDESEIDPGMVWHWRAANAGDWCHYLFEMDRERIRRVVLVEGERENRYGEQVGLLIFGLLLGDVFVKTQLHQWTIEMVSASEPSWSSVNNCTEEIEYPKWTGPPKYEWPKWFCWLPQYQTPVFSKHPDFN